MASGSEIQRQMIEAWNRRDWSAFRHFLHSGYRYTGPDGKEEAGPEAGLGIAQMYANAFPDGRLEVQNSFGAEDTSVTEMIVSGTHQADLKGIPATGKRIELRVANIVEIREGKVYREREYFDVMSMMTQLGVLQPGS
jgi:steroid delta-isomerase-like uncharacterized protein